MVTPFLNSSSICYHTPNTLSQKPHQRISLVGACRLTSQVDEHECTAATHSGDIRELPDVAETNGCSDCRQYECHPGGPGPIIVLCWCHADLLNLVALPRTTLATTRWSASRGANEALLSRAPGSAPTPS